MQLSDFGTEEQRVAALKELDILDTPPEERFDRLTRIATRIFNVPVAQITLLDGDRQWFKSIQGAELTEVPRAITFCTHTVETANGTMVITDAEKDSRFDGNPMVHSEPNIRFYAGSSLSYSENVRLGTLCILDVKPRQMSENDIAILEVFSRLVKSVCRSSDLIARIGGDEFVVLFMGSDKDSAEKKLKNLAEKIVEVNSNSPYEILFSHGVVECDLQKEISISALLDESDKLMYVDKNQKRKN